MANENELRDPTAEDGRRDARRRFLASCGRFAIATPPAMTLLLSATQQNYAVAGSNFHHGKSHNLNLQGNNGFGNGGNDGVPGKSSHSDLDR